MDSFGFRDGSISKLLESRHIEFGPDYSRSLQMHSSLIRRLSLEKEMEGHEAHEHSVNSIAWNSNGSLLISGSDDDQDATKENSHNSSCSSISHAINNAKNIESKIIRENNKVDHLTRSQSGNISQLQPNSSLKSTHKRIITNGELKEKLRRKTGSQENLRRTRSEDVSQSDNGVTKRVFRKIKVRRYKFLDEVSS